MKNQLEYVAVLKLLAYAGLHWVAHSYEQANAVCSFPSESLFIRNLDAARATFSSLHPGFWH